MSKHVSDAAWDVYNAMREAGQVYDVEEPLLLEETEEWPFRERDGTWRVLVHGDLRDIAITLSARESYR